MSEDVNKHTTYSADGVTQNLPSIPAPIVELSSGDDGEPLADSREVAKKLGRNLKHIHQAIRELDMSLNFLGRNFRPNEIKDLAGTHVSHYLMTEPGFMALCRSLKGGVATEIFEAFVNEFYRMREELRRVKTAPVALTQLEALKIAVSGWETAEADRQKEIAAHVQTKALAITYQAEADAAKEQAEIAETNYTGLQRIIYPGMNEGDEAPVLYSSVRSAAKTFGVSDTFLWKLLRDMDMGADLGGGVHPLGWLKYEHHKGKADQDEPYAFAKSDRRPVSGLYMIRKMVECRNNPHSDGSPRFQMQTFFLEKGLACMQAICDGIPEEVKNRHAWERKQKDARRAEREAAKAEKRNNPSKGKAA